MAAVKQELSSMALLVLLFCGCSSEPLGYSYGPPPPPKEETEVEVIKVEVYEVPWIGDQLQSSPSPSYGPPTEENFTIITDNPSITTTSSPSVVENSTVSSPNTTRSERLESDNGELTKGSYYIYHPSGQLQKVTYLTKNDDGKMEFSARLQYKDVEPVKGPIYTYDPATYVFSRLNR